MVYQIMNKCIAFARQGRPLGICGAIAAQTKGKIYVESYSEPAVVEAISGVRGLLQYTMRLVPIQDMTTVMTVVASKKPGTFLWLPRLWYSHHQDIDTHNLLAPRINSIFNSEKERVGPNDQRTLQGGSCSCHCRAGIRPQMRRASGPTLGFNPVQPAPRGSQN